MSNKNKQVNEQEINIRKSLLQEEKKREKAIIYQRWRKNKLEYKITKSSHSTNKPNKNEIEDNTKNQTQNNINRFIKSFPQNINNDIFKNKEKIYMNLKNETNLINDTKMNKSKRLLRRHNIIKNLLKNENKKLDFKIFYFIIIYLFFLDYSNERLINLYSSNITITIKGNGNQRIYYTGKQ